MFDPAEYPRVFGLPPGVEFSEELITGLRQQLTGHPPEAMARVTLIVNTRRMARRIREVFDDGPPGFLPRITTVTSLGPLTDPLDTPPATPALRRKLELAQLIGALLDQTPDLAPRAAVFDLADSLGALLDEMQGEGVSTGALERLDLSEQSGHWAPITEFLSIIRGFEARTGDPGTEQRHLMLVTRLIDQWQRIPPRDPIILAGSTGSRGTTQLLLRAIAALPQGAVILPGYDFDMPAPAWTAFDTASNAEDHPQYRFRTIQTGLGLAPGDIKPWTTRPPANPARNALISLALRPAPITDQWRDEGPRLDDIATATRDLTLVEARSQRTEALAIAMRLRKAVEDGQTAALITPDRGLTRQVAAALDRWRILPDDSAGTPLDLSAPGRFLRHVATLLTDRLSTELLLILLKHPLCHAGAARGDHLLLTRELELFLRRRGIPFPDATDIATWAARRDDPILPDWLTWFHAAFLDRHHSDPMPLTDWHATHMALAETLSHGTQPSAIDAPLWAGDAGHEARTHMDDLGAQAPHGGTATPHEYTQLLRNILSSGEVRSTVRAHPLIRIWGTLEARVQGADLLILAGLNEGTWPESPGHDPWLNRALRKQAGLLLPERRIGLAAHDFQQAVLAPKVWLTRAIRSDEAETVTSRWLNRLTNLLGGLPDQGGKQALRDMRARGDHWLALTQALEHTDLTTPAPRPAPCPPVATRPRELSVTRIQRLIRDPYAIYARYILGLQPLNPISRTPDALMRGTVLHEVAEEFIRATGDDDSAVTRDNLMAVADTVLARNVPWHQTRMLWHARLARIADTFIMGEQARRIRAHPTAFEVTGHRRIEALDFTLTAKADRIDRDPGGALWLYDYKTGALPSKSQQDFFDKQLLLSAAIAEAGGFPDLGLGGVGGAEFIGLGGKGETREAPLDDHPPVKVWAELYELINAYMNEEKGYVSRRAMARSTDQGDYDHLARFGEWDVTDAPTLIRLELTHG